MESIFTRYRNTTVLVAVLFAQIVGLAIQVKRPSDAGSTRLIRYWVVSAITPLERGVVGASHGLRHLWSNYLYLRGVREENRELKQQIDRMRIEDVRLKQDADQARRLQSLLAFKEQFISQTVAAQVIGSGGSDQSRVFYIDKDASDGLQPDMAVVTPDGIVGKVLRVYKGSSQVLEISDQSSGVGAILEKSRLQGILNGSGSGELFLKYVMSDEKVEPGERVLTSGGDRIFPKGLPVGTVKSVGAGPDLFHTIRVTPAADLGRMEEVLIITKVVDKEPEVQQAEGPTRASDILAQRLPTVQKKAPATPGVTPAPSSKPAAAPAASSPKPAATPAPGAPVASKPLAPKPSQPQPGYTPQAQTQTEGTPR